MFTGKHKKCLLEQWDQCVTNRVLGYCGPNCLQIMNKLLLCRFGLIHHLSHDYPHPRSQDLAQAPDVGHFTFLPFPSNCTSSCHLLIKLLADGFVFHASLVLVYSFVPEILWQLFGLAHSGGDVRLKEICCVDRKLSDSVDNL